MYTAKSAEGKSQTVWEILLLVILPIARRPIPISSPCFQ
uniref:Uncharacterized protein n=1 Tax=Anguilla anguilla TaxID=7936 RepID=A0A0E9T5K8_ANGAN